MDLDPNANELVKIRLRHFAEWWEEEKRFANELAANDKVSMGSIDSVYPSRKKLRIDIRISYE